jgi:hypothetical protein
VVGEVDADREAGGGLVLLRSARWTVSA